MLTIYKAPIISSYCQNKKPIINTSNDATLKTNPTSSQYINFCGKDSASNDFLSKDIYSITQTIKKINSTDVITSEQAMAEVLVIYETKPNARKFILNTLLKLVDRLFSDEIAVKLVNNMDLTDVALPEKYTDKCLDSIYYNNYSIINKDLYQQQVEFLLNMTSSHPEITNGLMYKILEKLDNNTDLSLKLFDDLSENLNMQDFAKYHSKYINAHCLIRSMNSQDSKNQEECVEVLNKLCKEKPDYTLLIIRDLYNNTDNIFNNKPILTFIETVCKDNFANTKEAFKGAMQYIIHSNKADDSILHFLNILLKNVNDSAPEVLANTIDEFQSSPAIVCQTIGRIAAIDEDQKKEIKKAFTDILDKMIDLPILDYDSCNLTNEVLQNLYLMDQNNSETIEQCLDYCELLSFHKNLQIPIMDNLTMIAHNSPKYTDRVTQDLKTLKLSYPKTYLDCMLFLSKDNHELSNELLKDAFNAIESPLSHQRIENKQNKHEKHAFFNKNVSVKYLNSKLVISDALKPESIHPFRPNIGNENLTKQYKFSQQTIAYFLNSLPYCCQINPKLRKEAFDILNHLIKPTDLLLREVNDYQDCHKELVFKFNIGITNIAINALDPLCQAVPDLKEPAQEVLQRFIAQQNEYLRLLRKHNDGSLEGMFQILEDSIDLALDKLDVLTPNDN